MYLKIIIKKQQQNFKDISDEEDKNVAWNSWSPLVATSMLLYLSL